MQEWGMEGVIRYFPMLAARAHKNLLDLRNMGGARSMRAVWKVPDHPSNLGGDGENSFLDARTLMTRQPAPENLNSTTFL